MPVVSYVFSASFGMAIGALFGPLGIIAYVFAAIVLLWSARCFLSSSECDGEELAHMAVPVGAGCVGLAVTSDTVIVWEIVFLTCAVVIVVPILLFVSKKFILRKFSRGGE